ncbi:hypothetical protein TPHA_0K00800 [Tetrapisispora phaffii CBS 4417]|uniref:Nucleoporin Nup133/Nup155-like N-terminal domain-containing protein n=1 Tax=Tetrapisispora phaffii (strain ATCC 24235 / CBS 4417 / NBRC 1672 / NRRL Y-8282 / UCD 70-5) TaxID=1071381 RepID=G8BZ86_TETPH|nr:hypothetical protein TPHA_0K00800 [Tetrapisispora phaffii CBS 4417]CCE65214.1 hypothetical protein TPHA_0K00800 [Tetrapisispora phaffii CBS 4417]
MFSTPLKNSVDYQSTTTYASLTNNGTSNANSGSLVNSNNSIAVNNKMSSNLNSNLNTSNINGLDLGSSANGGRFISDSNGPNASGLYSNNNTEHLRINGMGNVKPLDLATQYIDYLLRRDANTPVLDERSYYNNGVVYNFSKEVGGLGAFTPFERQQVINIPDEILKDSSKAEIKNEMGIFTEINRCWIIIDNKLVLWNIHNSTEFQTIDEIKHTILKVALVKPKPNTFVDNINHLLLIATPFDLFIFAISYNKKTNDFSVYNTEMSVSVHGLDIADIATYDKTGQIFFTGKNNGTNIWELQYSGSDDWYNSKCTKVCLTQSTLSSLMPTNIVSKIPGSNYIQSFFEEDSKYHQEYITKLTIDQSRGIVYTLSSKSIIRAYLIASNKSLTGPMTIDPSYIKRIIGTTTARGAAILSNKFLKLSKIIPVTQYENSNLFFIAITIGGVRLHFNGSVGRSSIEALRLESIKFPPSSVTQQVMQQELQKEQLEQQKRSLPFYSSLTSSESVLLRFQKKSSVLLETTSASTIISPGMFFSSIIKSEQNPNPPTGSTTTPVKNKLFVSVPDYGILKTHGKYIENATFLDTTSVVREIVPLTAGSNATLKQEGYANTFATQYNSENMRVAVLTNSAIEIYRYRSPDEIFEALIGNPLPFVVNYGLTEACSTALYVACKSNKSDSLRSAALTFFFVGLPGILDIKPKYNRYSSSAVSSLLGKPTSTTGSMLSSATPQKSSSSLFSDVNANNTNFSLDDVFLSARFYAIPLLIGRLFRDIWEKPVFMNDRPKTQQTSPFGTNLISSAPVHITKISISKNDVDYYLSSIQILNEFFEVYSSSISTIYTPLLSNTHNTTTVTDKSESVAYQAENIAIGSMIKLVGSMKESLMFLKVLYGESEVDGFENNFSAFNDIVNNLNAEVQSGLVVLKYKDLFAPNDKTKSYVKEIFSSIINRNITRGASIEYIATALQERCGSFCSSSDILGFRAVEHLRKAKEIGLRDYESLSYHLNNAISLFEKIVDDVSIDKLKEATAIMLDLKYFPKTIQFLLNMANFTDKGNLAYQYFVDSRSPNDERKRFYDKRLVIYDMVFEILIKVDKIASSYASDRSNNLNIQNEWSVLREQSYNCVFSYKDKLFHYQLYDWLVSQKEQDKLLQLDTEYILPYLQEKAKDLLEISNLLWVYYSKRSNFYEAANILYSLSISNFDISLGDRIELLSRANGFCNSACPTDQKQNMMQLSDQIQEIFEIPTIQDEILSLVSSDNRIDSAMKKELIAGLNGKFLSVNELYNDFAVPLGYYEVCLNIFKVSDFRNKEEIMETWSNLFASLKKELRQDSNSKYDESINFINLLSNVVTKIGRNVHTSEFIFPVESLFPIVYNLFHELLPKDHIQSGVVTSIFVNSGVSYKKIYYTLRDLIETSPLTATDDSKSVPDYTTEMIWLIQEWYKTDRKLREIIDTEQIRNLTVYKIENDPLEQYMKKTGNSI